MLHVLLLMVMVLVGCGTTETAGTSLPSNDVKLQPTKTPAQDGSGGSACACPASTVPGPMGPPGPASTVPGPASTVPGPKGDRGEVGATGSQGSPGLSIKGDKGDTGSPGQSIVGPMGPASIVPGPVGSTGKTGSPGAGFDRSKMYTVETQVVYIAGASQVSALAFCNNTNDIMVRGGCYVASAVAGKVIRSMAADAVSGQPDGWWCIGAGSTTVAVVTCQTP